MENSNGRTMVSIEDNTFNRDAFIFRNHFYHSFLQCIEGGKDIGRRRKSFYIIIQCTDEWPKEYYKEVGQGTVHDYLLKNVLGMDSDQKRIACGGFAYLLGQLKFSSMWLNGTDQADAPTDGSRYLSEPEKALVTYCWEEYKRHGTEHVFPIPFSIDELLLN